MILCDLDMVLATSYGNDTVPGQPIHKTFRERPTQFDLIKSDGIPFYIVTAKVEQEARTVLHAIGLEEYITSVIGANSLLWPTLWRAVKKRRIPTSISKAFWRSAIRGVEALRKTECVVMIEDRRSNLQDMLEYGSIDVGILVPQMRLAGESVVEWFDLDLALRLARVLVLGMDEKEVLSGGSFRVYQWRGSGLESAASGRLFTDREKCRYLIELPAMPPTHCQEQDFFLRSFETGCNLVASKRNMASLLRAGKKIYTKILPLPHQ